MKTSSILVGIGVFVALGVVGGGLAFVKYRQIQAGMNQPAFEPPEAVNLMPVKPVNWQPTSDLVGTVLSLRTVNVMNEVEGVVTVVGFKSGDIVDQGQMLVKLDDSTDRAELATAEAAMRVAEAEISVKLADQKLAEDELRMQDAAAQSRATSNIEVSRARAEVERSGAEVIRARAAADEAKARIARVNTRLKKHEIRAPFRARVGLRNVHEGQFLAAPFGMDATQIATLQEMSDKIYIDFAVPQEQLDRVKIGLVVMGELQGTSGTTGGEPIRLEVSALDATANPTTRNVRVRTITDNSKDTLRPGMFVKVRVPTEASKEYLSVPVKAIRRASYANQVFVVEEVQEPGPDGKPMAKMRAKQRFVTLGPTIGEDVIVLSGLKAGEQVATSGSFKLRENALVMPVVEGAGGGGLGGGPGGAPGGVEQPQAGAGK